MIYKLTYIFFVVSAFSLWQLNEAESIYSKIGLFGVVMCLLISTTKYSPFSGAGKKKNN